MLLKSKQKNVELRCEDLISELQDVVVKKYGRNGVTLSKKSINDSSIELSFNVGKEELIAMKFNKTEE